MSHRIAVQQTAFPGGTYYAACECGWAGREHFTREQASTDPEATQHEMEVGLW